MSGVWNSNDTGSSSVSDKFGELFKDEFAVILLQGKNSFGDMIYSYVKVGLPNIKRLYATLKSGADFSPSDFGEIVASGRGVPTPELKAEMASTYNMLQQNSPTPAAAPAFSPPPAEEIKKKAWDEF